MGFDKKDEKFVGVRIKIATEICHGFVASLGYGAFSGDDPSPIVSDAYKMADEILRQSKINKGIPSLHDSHAPAVSAPLKVLRNI